MVVISLFFICFFIPCNGKNSDSLTVFVLEVNRK